MSRKRDDAATAGAGFAGVVGGNMLRQQGIRRAYLEDTPRPIKRPKGLGAELRMIKHPRGRKSYLTGAAVSALSLPAATVGSYRLARPESASKRDKDDPALVQAGLTGASAALREKVATQREAPPGLVGRNYLTGAGISAAGTGLTALALQRKKMPKLATSGIAGGAGAALGIASLPAQAKMIERQTRGQYTVTPAGVKRRKAAAVRPSRGAVMVDQKSGRVLPEGVRKAVGDPGADMSRGQRRALVTASSPPVPVVGDLIQATAAGRLAPEGRRKRTAAQAWAGNQAGNAVGMAGGAVGAAYLANRSERAMSALTNANTKVEGWKSRATDPIVNRTPDKLKTGYGSARSTMRSRAGGISSPRVASAAGKIAGSAPYKMVMRHKAPAAIGGLVGGAVLGQAGLQAAYGRAMTRDDRYRRANQSARRGTSVVKSQAGSNLSARERNELADKKRKAAILSVVSGGAGMAALGMTGTTAALSHKKLKRIPRLHRVAEGANKVKTPLLTTSAGVGGYSSMNYARMQMQEAKSLNPKVSVGHSVSKAWGLRVIRPTGIRRRPAVRGGHIRRVRKPSGVIRTSTVRGSFA